MTSGQGKAVGDITAVRTWLADRTDCTGEVGVVRRPAGSPSLGGRTALHAAAADSRPDEAPRGTVAAHTAGVHLRSLNVGRPRENPWKGLPATGIDKRPVSHPVAVTAPGPKGTGAVGLAGDRAHDVQHHGGADQALYAYAREDLDSWEERLGRRLHDGSSFGENLTTVGVDVNGALIGERWRIGSDVLLEVTCPRIPCATFSGWLGEPDWLRRFLQAGQPGAYLRVVAEGSVRAGDAIHIVSRPQHDVTVALTFRALTTEPDLLPRLAVADALPEDAQALVRRRTR